MKAISKHLAGAAALLALSQPALAQNATAQGTPCVQAADLADTLTYAVPMMMDAAQTTCAGVLAEDSFLMSQGQDFASRFAAIQDQSWPGTRRLLTTFMQSEAKSGAVSGMLGELDDEALRPFVDAIVGPIIVQELKPASCGSIEQILTLIAPLPAENFGPLLATVFGLVGDSDETLKICPAQS